MPRFVKFICLLCIVTMCRQVVAQQNSAANTNLQLLYLRSTGPNKHSDIFRKCDDLTIAHYRELGVEVIEKSYSDLADWIMDDGVDLIPATRHMQYLAYARAQNAQAIGGLTATNLEAREAGWRKVDPGLYIHGWSINLTTLTHHFLVDVKGGLSTRAVPLHLAGTSEPPWAIANRVSLSTCDSTDKQLREFTAKDINGVNILTKNLKGKIVLVDFWATWCKPCLDEFPIMQALRDKLPESDYAWVSISVDDNDRQWRQFVTNNNLGGIQIRDENLSWKHFFNVSSYPSAFVIDREGVIHCKVRGDEIPKAVLALISKGKTSNSK